jgi:hypothetical protein
VGGRSRLWKSLSRLFAFLVACEAFAVFRERRVRGESEEFGEIL